MNLLTFKVKSFGEGCLNVLYYMSNLWYASELIEDERDTAGIFS